MKSRCRRYDPQYRVLGGAPARKILSSVPGFYCRYFVVNGSLPAYLSDSLCQPPPSLSQRTKLCRLANHKVKRPALTKTRNTTPPKSTSSKGSKQSGNAPECISATPTSAVCTTAFSRSSITQSTSILPG